MRTIVFPERGRAEVQGEAGLREALAFRDSQPVVEELPRSSECEPGTVLVQAVYTGMTNGTERNVLLGGNYSAKQWPIKFIGYQHVGRVLAVGAGVEGFAVDDLVYSGATPHVEYYRTPVSEHSLLIKIPDGVEPHHAALFGVSSVAMHDVRRAEVKLGERVLVVGAGLIGQFSAQCARLAGAVVTVCDLDPERLAIARSLGAHQTVTLTPEASSWDAVKEQGPFDAVFEDSGASVLDQIIGTSFGDGILRPPAPGGQSSRVVLIAGRERVDYSFNAAQGLELSIIHASHFNLSDLSEVARFTVEGNLQIGPLITNVVKLEDAPGLYERLVSQPASLLGTVFDWQ